MCISSCISQRVEATDWVKQMKTCTQASLRRQFKCPGCVPADMPVDRRTAVILGDQCFSLEDLLGKALTSKTRQASGHDCSPSRPEHGQSPLQQMYLHEA